MINYNFGNGSGVFFTSDTHFGHSNILKFCDRPFTSIEEMDETFIKNWNAVVEPNDIVFHLGDFAFGGSDLWRQVLMQLHGHIYLIVGNHDRKNLREGYVKYFAQVTPQMQIEIGGRSVYLNHYPFLCYGGVYRNNKSQVFNLHGHVHLSKYKNNGLDFDRCKQMLFPSQYDVGVDLNDFRPISWEECNKKIEFQIEHSVNGTYWCDNS